MSVVVHRVVGHLNCTTVALSKHLSMGHGLFPCLPCGGLCCYHTGLQVSLSCADFISFEYIFLRVGQSGHMVDLFSVVWALSLLTCIVAALAYTPMLLRNLSVWWEVNFRIFPLCFTFKSLTVRCWDESLFFWFCQCDVYMLPAFWCPYCSPNGGFFCYYVIEQIFKIVCFPVPSGIETYMFSQKIIQNWNCFCSF